MLKVKKPSEINISINKRTLTKICLKNNTISNQLQTSVLYMISNKYSTSLPSTTAFETNYNQFCSY